MIQAQWYRNIKELSDVHGVHITLSGYYGQDSIYYGIDMADLLLSIAAMTPIEELRVCLEPLEELADYLEEQRDEPDIDLDLCNKLATWENFYLLQVADCVNMLLADRLGFNNVETGLIYPGFATALVNNQLFFVSRRSRFYLILSEIQSCMKNRSVYYKHDSTAVNPHYMLNSSMGWLNG